MSAWFSPPMTSGRSMRCCAPRLDFVILSHLKTAHHGLGDLPQRRRTKSLVEEKHI